MSLPSEEDWEKVGVFARAWSDDILADDIATKLTCYEADALIEVLRAAGEVEAAEMWLVFHAGGDEPDDAHYVDPDEEEDDDDDDDTE